MSLILHIDTAIDTASICLSDNEQVLFSAQNTQTRESAGWLQPAIQSMLQQGGISLQQLQAVSVSAGPGSYTGLRVGMASAKGLCYALNIPLLTVDTLQSLAGGALRQVGDTVALLCPMIDARRMEVFTAIYDRELQEVLAPTNLIVEPSSLDKWLDQHTVYFFGNGSNKVKDVLQHAHAQFIEVHSSATHLVPLAYQQWMQQQFAPLAYAEPKYVKGFYSPQPR
ncbi:tRNA (adenosine(37)-N6)-threonylcarbamoyltransferase complex dimerization subunit type 1 TsaB [Pseudocnuella soli]|uniref:tRNA (adenosine(37)-N6)-threonylcarbamoyltransferase complex dimerization subunit type 1 TsaB n=1 Tax=Pseudocnuella soli TaxID=2502779 RepID=UPI00104EBA2F|nr:tRNA (adenosine(37)-N6)-threonylcarbamoyltransferase complex dimerization subunit type 1 TsaB [Pseudocnuella soli]